MSTSPNFYLQRAATLKAIGFQSYRDYLESDVWLSLRERVLERSDWNCRSCGGRASEVHHKSYSEDALRGRNLEELVPLCRKCHLFIEMRPDGRKDMDPMTIQGRLHQILTLRSQSSHVPKSSRKDAWQIAQEQSTAKLTKQERKDREWQEFYEKYKNRPASPELTRQERGVLKTLTNNVNDARCRLASRRQRKPVEHRIKVMQRAEKQLNDFLAALKCDAKQKDALLTACSVHRSLDQLFAERCA